ncbi:hypothetical protein NKH77_48370 [Streptomyces sp. M19]
MLTMYPTVAALASHVSRLSGEEPPVADPAQAREPTPRGAGDAGSAGSASGTGKDRMRRQRDRARRASGEGRQ